MFAKERTLRCCMSYNLYLCIQIVPKVIQSNHNFHLHQLRLNCIAILLIVHRTRSHEFRKIFINSVNNKEISVALFWYILQTSYLIFWTTLYNLSLYRGVLISP